jgi:starch synthase
VSGKAICKQQLQEEAGLMIEPAVPLIGMVTRIDDQKGLDLIISGLDRILGSGAQFVSLGTGDPWLEAGLTSIGHRYPAQARVFLKFDVALAQRIYSGSDLFLMPSRFEPCGLGQMIAMRYGTIPVVRKTSGLANTVEAWDSSSGTGNGFLFTGYNAQELVDSVEQALTTYRVSSDWKRLIRNAMTIDFSWVQSAHGYLHVYDMALRAGVRVGFDTEKGERETHGGRTAN